MKSFFYVPENLDLKLLLIQSGNEGLATPKHLDRFYYIIDLIYLTKIISRLEENAYVRINHKILERILTTRFASKVKKLLIELNIIEENPTMYGKVNYIPLIQSKAFRVSEKYSQSTFRRIPASNHRILAKIEAWQNRITQEAIAGENGKALIKASIDNLRLEIDSAVQYLQRKDFDTPRMKQLRHLIIESFNNRDYSMTVDDSGRLHHFFTRCPRDIRQFFTFKGRPIYEIDASDCQPALHATLYRSNSPERKKFAEIVSHGKFKEFINCKLSAPFDLTDDHQKKSFKQELFHHVFYGSAYSKTHSEVKDVFQREFPELAAIIAEEKRYGTHDLPVHMQTLEAGIVVEKVANYLANVHKDEPEFCLISIHDCLVTTQEHVEEVKQAMADEFTKLLGFDLTFKIKRLSRESVQNSNTGKNELSYAPEAFTETMPLSA